MGDAGDLDLGDWLETGRARSPAAELDRARKKREDDRSMTEDAS